LSSSQTGLKGLEGDAKEIEGVKLAQVKTQIALLLEGMSFQEAENLMFKFLTELKGKAFISSS